MQFSLLALYWKCWCDSRRVQKGNKLEKCARRAHLYGSTGLFSILLFSCLPLLELSTNKCFLQQREAITDSQEVICVV